MKPIHPFEDPIRSRSGSRVGLLRVWVGAVAALFFHAAASANAIDDLHAFTKEIRTAKGSFTQKVQSRTQKAVQPTSGDFVFARPGKFRWTYSKPFEQLLVADGTKLSIYDKDLNQVTVSKLGDALGSSPAAILFGSNDVEQNFALNDTGVRDGVAWLEATPKAKASNFEKISIGFRNGELAAMELKDALGQVTLLEFSNVERNPKVDPSAFVFTPPKGADVLNN